MKQNQYLQNCGDILEIIKLADKKGYYHCKFLKYPCEVLATKQHILIGSVINPEIERIEFLEKEWPQNCGDSLRIIKKEEGTSYYEVEFIKYPFKKRAKKYHIVNGSVVNPLIEDLGFLYCTFEQNCGDSLKVLKKTNKKDINNHHFLYECEFIKYPCKVYVRKSHVIDGVVDNPQIEKDFMIKIWSQNCGDNLKVIEKIKGEKGKYKCQFQKYPCEIIGYKKSIVKGEQDNPNLPIYNKDLFLSYLKDFFIKNNKKIKIEEICTEFNRAKRTILNKISEFKAYDYIDYNWSISSIPEEEVRDYCCSINNSFLEKSTCKELDGKEIDIYSPKLKLGIEFNGDYWHSDEVVLKKKGITSKEADLLKYNLAKEKGIDLYFIWEHDWKGRQEVVKRYLKIIIYKQLRKINKN